MKQHMFNSQRASTTRGGIKTGLRFADMEEISRCEIFFPNSFREDIIFLKSVTTSPGLPYISYLIKGLHI